MLCVVCLAVGVLPLAYLQTNNACKGILCILLKDFLFLFSETVDSARAVAGTSAELPCRVQNFHRGEEADRAKLVMWFKNGSETPFYTYDAVSSTIEPVHWRDEGAQVSSRSQFVPQSAGVLPHLRINSTTVEDAGQYKCRVDYVLHQTTFHQVNLEVIIPSSVPRIYRDGRLVERWIQAVENQTLELTCKTQGGNPLPSLSWWKDDSVLESSFDL